MGGAAQQAPHDFSGSTSVDGFDSLTDDLRARVKSELEPGERLLWAARSEPPAVRFGFGFYALGVIAAVLLILGAIGMLRALDSGRSSDGSEVVAGMIFAGISSVIIIGLIGNRVSRVDQWSRAASVCYAITDRRAIIWTPVPKSNAVRIQTIPRGDIRSLVRVENPGGSGSVLFSTGGDSRSGEIHVDWYPHGFRNVPDVRRVEQIVRNTMLKDEQRA